MHYTIFIADLLLPQAAGRAPYAGLRLPALETIFARGTLTSHPPLAAPEWLCRSFGIASQQDWPTAPLLAQADGIAPEHDFWLHADPVYLQANLSQLVLAQAITDLDENAAQTLIAALNQHFAQDGLVFCAPRPQHWYLRTKQTPALITTPLTEALGRNIDPVLPRGNDALLWHRRLNEAQMILHEHPVNAAREARGARPINSIWLGGGGVMPKLATPNYDAMWASLDNVQSSEYRLALALARASGIELATPSTTISVGDSLYKKPLLWLSAQAQAGNVDAWRAQLIAIDHHWLAPLLASLAAGKIGRLTLAAGNDERALGLNIMPSQVRRWWQRRRPLMHYLERITQ